MNINKKLFLFTLSSLLVLNYFVYRFFYFGFYKNENIYLESDFFVLKSFSTLPNLIYFFLTIAIILLNRKKLGWKYDWYSKFRLPVIIVSTFMGLYFISTGYNFYFDSGFYFDKLIILLIIISVYISPYFLLFLYPLIWLSMSQLNLPIGGYSITDKMLPLMLINFFVTSFLFRSVFKLKFKLITTFKIDKYIFKELVLSGLLIIVSGAYFIPFLGKLSISPGFFDWGFKEDFALAVVKYFDRGWLLNFHHKTIIIEVVKNLSSVLLTFALLIEGSVLLISKSKKTAMIVLLLVVILHFAIFSLSGILFWKWIITDLCVFYILYRYRWEVFSKPFYSFTILLFIIFSDIFLPFNRLAWFSTNYSSNYYINVIDENNHEYSVSPNSFHPYEIFMEFSRWNLYNNNLNTTTNEFAKVSYDYDKKSFNTTKNLNYSNLIVLKSFFKRYFTNYNNNISKRSGNFLPNHIYSNPGSKIDFDFKTKVKTVKIYNKECLYNDVLEKKCEVDLIDVININK